MWGEMGEIIRDRNKNPRLILRQVGNGKRTRSRGQKEAEQACGGSRGSRTRLPLGGGGSSPSQTQEPASVASSAGK